MRSSFSLFDIFFNTSHHSLGLEYWNHTTKLESLVARQLIAKKDQIIGCSYVCSKWGPNLTNLYLQNNILLRKIQVTIPPLKLNHTSFYFLLEYCFYSALFRSFIWVLDILPSTSSSLCPSKKLNKSFILTWLYFHFNPLLSLFWQFLVKYLSSLEWSWRNHTKSFWSLTLILKKVGQGFLNVFL